MRIRLMLIVCLCLICAAFNHRSKYAGYYKAAGLGNLALYKNGTYSFFKFGVMADGGHDHRNTGTWKYSAGKVILNSFNQPVKHGIIIVNENYESDLIDSIRFKYFFIYENENGIDTVNFIGGGINTFEVNNVNERYYFPHYPQGATITIKKIPVQELIFRILVIDYPMYYVKNRKANSFTIFENVALPDGKAPSDFQYDYFTDERLSINNDTLILNNYIKLVKEDNSNDL